MKRRARIRVALPTVLVVVLTLGLAGAFGSMASPVSARAKEGRGKEGKVTEFSAGINPGPLGITAGPDGNLWFTELGTVDVVPDTGEALVAGSGIGRITPKGEVTEFSAGLSPNSQAAGITVGPDGNLWFGEVYEGRVGRITPAGVITEFATPPGGGPSPDEVGLTAGPDGNLWFNGLINGIVRITPAGVVTEFSQGFGTAPDYNYPQGVPIAGPDGNLWLTDQEGIGRITPDGVYTGFRVGLTGRADPGGITAGPDGNVWFTGYYEDGGGLIGRITPAGEITEFSAGLTPKASPSGITAGPDGNLWFTEFDEKRIGRITPAGVITEFSAGLAADARPSGITVGCDGNLWFSEYDELNGSGTNQIGRITPKGKVTEFSKGLTGTPSGLTAGPDGNLWFTETNNGQIGRIEPGPAAKPRGKQAPTLPAACPRARG